uniref:Uncharacterized protein n=1 Tax=Oryza sativa subsp. japonica TaxID=39947 RepID=Q6ZG75_ORYSJ|nr:hypothetical protein [Oryza sativa Japonica Group]
MDEEVDGRERPPPNPVVRRRASGGGGALPDWASRAALPPAAFKNGLTARRGWFSVCELGASTTSGMVLVFVGIEKARE